jgi:membrane associated rhomboid family serine protease
MRITIFLLVANIAVFILQGFFPGFTQAFALTPAIAMEGAYWQFISYMFLHGGSLHIFLNMFVLIIFGFGVERALGTQKYLALYFISGLGSAFLHIFLTGESMIPMLGASGALFGVLTAYGFLFPKNWIIMFPGIPMPAIAAVFVFAGIEIFLGFSGLQPGVANFGHLGGIVTGIALMLIWKYTGRKKKKYLDTKNFEFFWE